MLLDSRRFVFRHPPHTFTKVPLARRARRAAALRILGEALSAVRGADAKSRGEGIDARKHIDRAVRVTQAAAQGQGVADEDEDEEDQQEQQGEAEQGEEGGGDGAYD